METRRQPVCVDEQDIRIPIGDDYLTGTLHPRPGAKGLVLYPSESGLNRHSPCSSEVMRQVVNRGMSALHFHLLTEREAVRDMHSWEFRENAALLAERLVSVTDWLSDHKKFRALRPGYMGSRIWGAAALMAASARPDRVGAVVSRGNRTLPNGPILAGVLAPTLLLVPEYDPEQIALNLSLLERLGTEVKELSVVPGATDDFEDSGAVERVARLTVDWFLQYLLPEEKDSATEEEPAPAFLRPRGVLHVRESDR